MRAIEIDPTTTVVQRLADSTCILAQRLCEWCGHGPAIEEDLAISNVALDLLGQTRLWYAYLCGREKAGRGEDDLAFLRDAPEWRNLLVVELPNGDYARTLVRQWLFDTWHHQLLTHLTASADEHVAGIAQKAVREVTYHLRRSSDLIVRLGDGTAESHARTAAALLELWPYTGEFFEDDDADRAAAAAGVAPLPSALSQGWHDRIASVAAQATLTLPTGTWMQRGSRSGRHTEHLGYLLAEMQFLQRAYPGAEW